MVLPKMMAHIPVAPAAQTEVTDIFGIPRRILKKLLLVTYMVTGKESQQESLEKVGELFIPAAEEAEAVDTITRSIIRDPAAPAVAVEALVITPTPGMGQRIQAAAEAADITAQLPAIVTLPALAVPAS